MRQQWYKNNNQPSLYPNPNYALRITHYELKMKITIIAIGKLKEKYLVDAVNEYLKRLKPFANVDIVELPECRTVDEECEKILSRLSKDAWICVLDVIGEAMSSEELAQTISNQALNGQSKLIFVIGGAFGLNEKLRGVANLRLSLSKMTFTHQMTRVILLEQIYRSFKINRGEPYHY